MKRNRKPAAMICLCMILLLTAGCSKKEDSRSIVYEDMKAAFEQSALLSANIGIFSRTERRSVMGLRFQRAGYISALRNRRGNNCQI